MNHLDWALIWATVVLAMSISVLALLAVAR